MIGHDPIAVLATLILMSYTKILKIIVDVYAFMELDYPNNQTISVWCKDAIFAVPSPCANHCENSRPHNFVLPEQSVISFFYLYTPKEL